MKLIEKVKSSVDNVTKYVFKYNERCVVEFSYIDSGTGKDIICVPTHTMCNVGCKFCHTTDYIGKIQSFALSETEIASCVNVIINDIEERYETLLISYMGCGEPMNNHMAVFFSMGMIETAHCRDYKIIRFGVATCLPRNSVEAFLDFCKRVKASKYSVKLHLSLHYTNDKLRKEWMPNSLDIKSSLALCKFYKEFTGNNVEVHYTLIENVNDYDEDIYGLNSLLMNTGFNLKFITYNKKETLNNGPSSRIAEFKDKIRIPYEYFSANGQDIGSACGMYLLDAYREASNITTEQYTPPGRDVGASCGQFFLDNYSENK